MWQDRIALDTLLGWPASEGRGRKTEDRRRPPRV
jgi:hypothetical protein